MYIIKNHKNLYIRLNSNGVPVTGTRTEAQLFDKDKANNIVKNLPKSLKKLKFIVLSAPMNDKKDEINKGAETGADDKIEKEEEFITSPPDYKIAPEVSRWVEKVEICEEVANEAKMRINELNSLISASDKEISNILHRIELEPPQNAVNGYYRYKEMRDVLQNRRKIKNEGVEEWLESEVKE